MTTLEKNVITVETTVNASIDKVWEIWNNPAHITKWCVATDTWHTPHATNDLKVGGRFTTRMEAKDGSFGFDFGGIYNAVIENSLIEYTMDDNRTAKIEFSSEDGKTKIIESFEAEEQNPLEMQQAGWQAILDNFKIYTEAQL